MTQYFVRRLLLLIPTVFLVSVFVFSIIRFFPGDVIVVLFRDADLTQADRARERARLGLERPIHEQYAIWVASVLRGDLGRSFFNKQPVLEEMKLRIPVTAELGLLAILFGLVLAIPTGVVSAVRQDTWMDYLMRGFSIGALSVPGFWIATVVIIALTLWFRWIPSLTYVPLVKDPVENLKQFLIPAVILGISMSGTLMRMTRTTLLEVLRQDYIRTAWAKGLRERAILGRHALRNALIPVVTILGVEVARVVSASVVMETIFDLPGVGKYIVDTIVVRDYPAVQGINLFLAVFILVVNLLVDVSHGYLDPRVRFR
ncbi:MAG: ABC transporter permease [Chloroflexi bacterium]|nr:ABC transporter permease [Chloroflexota bacterium]